MAGHEEKAGTRARPTHPVDASSPPPQTVGRIAADHGEDLRRFLRSRVPDPSDREDVAQEVFLRLSGYEGLDRIRNPRAFMFQIAQNVIRDRRRRARTRQEARHGPIDAHDIPASDPDPAHVVEQRDDLNRVKAAILALDEPARTAFMLSRYKEMSYDEIALRMGVSVKTVEKYISASLVRLRLAVGAQPPPASSSPGKEP